MAKFEVVSDYSSENIALPVRKTAQSAGYDIAAAQDMIIYPYQNLCELMLARVKDAPNGPLTLDEMNKFTKQIYARPALVPTGIKCKLDPGTYLELSVRSSTPLKYWLIMANGIGIIDADYYNNPENEGHIYFQLINLSPYPILIRKGDIIGQGIIKNYGVTEDDCAFGERTGGFGSTTNG